MPDRPWSKFFWSDWESDERLRLCSLAAQGLWMRMLCICAKGDPHGYLAIAGRPLDAADVARLAGVTTAEAETLMAELDERGVFSRDRKGRIYSRRMVKDAKKGQIAQKNGRKGGNPSLGKQRENRPSDNPQVGGEVKPHKPEARSQSNRDSLAQQGANAPRARAREEPPDAALLQGSDSEHEDLSDLFAELQRVIDAGRPLDMSPVRRWVAWGCDPAADILATVEGVMARRRDLGQGPPNSLKYFEAAVLQARDERLGNDAASAPVWQPKPGNPYYGLPREALPEAERKRRERLFAAMQRWMDDGMPPGAPEFRLETWEGGFVPPPPDWKPPLRVVGGRASGAPARGDGPACRPAATGGAGR